ncbi:hypothetical protein ABV409_12505 [Flagellimonas sp. DF-77]|uniref:hypothetical protein n=1 Tax=Flagellimonas algarum TaxID=3230298 RepID=UPI0033973505
MKNSNRIPFISACLALLVFACQEQPKPESEAASSTQVVTIERPKEIIDLDAADSLFVNYSQRRTEAIVAFENTKQESDAEAFEPTRFVSFDLEVVKQYIAYVEQEGEKGGAKIDSLRIYLGNYGEVDGANDRHNTVFIVPAAQTKAGYGGIYIDEEGQAQLMTTYFHGKGNGQSEPKSEASMFPSLNTNLYNGGSLVLNFGHCCPPNNGDF